MSPRISEISPSLRDRVLACFPAVAQAQATVEPLGHGLINQTFLVRAESKSYVLQRLSPIFSPLINQNIAAVSRSLQHAGLTTPHLLAARDGRLWCETEEPGEGQTAIWRLQTFVRGVSFDKVQSTAQAYAAGMLVARFHRALDNLAHTFVGLRQGVHDTPKHLSHLRDALARNPGHPLYGQVQEVAKAIFARAEDLPPLPTLVPRICHGDLKLNNILFAGSAAPASESAVCLIDLDTVGPLSLAYELGDAWRSWCNPVGEDSANTSLRVDILQASFEGYALGIGRSLTLAERRALLGGIEWISLELACRFATDALLESYFGWDAQRYPTRGDHNLVRSQGQMALHEACLATRTERAAVLGLLSP